MDVPIAEPARYSGALLHVLQNLTGVDHIDELRAAAEAGEHDALLALAWVAKECLAVLPMARQRCVDLWQAESFIALSSEGRYCGELAAALEDRVIAVESFVMAAKSFYRRGLLPITITVYLRTIDVALSNTPPLRRYLSLAFDNIGVVLLDLGRVDEAHDYFQRALEYEDDPLTRLKINNQVANCFEQFSEFVVAQRMHAANVAEMESHYPAEKTLLSVFRDNWARVAMSLGEYDRAITLLTDAGAGFAHAPLQDRIVNVLSRSHAYSAAGNAAAAGADFERAWELAVDLARSRIDPDHYRAGFARMLPKLVPVDGEIWRELLFAQSLTASGDWSNALPHYERVARRADEAGDLITHLRALVDAAAVMADSQDGSRTSGDLLNYVRSRSQETGLPQPMAQSALTLSAGLLSGSERNDTGLDALELTAEAMLFVELSESVTAEVPPDRIGQITTVDRGLAHARLASQASTAGASRMAIEHWRTSVDLARQYGHRLGELNRSVGLLAALDSDPGHQAEAVAVADAIRRRLEDTSDDAVAALLARRGLGSRVNAPVAAVALADLRVAAGLLETLRARQPLAAGGGRLPGSRRSDLDRSYGVYPALHRRMVGCGVPAGEAFEALQAMRARELMETGTARAGQETPYRPPTVVQAQELLAELPFRSTLVDITWTDTGLRAYLLDLSGLRVVDVAGDPDALIAAQRGDVRRRSLEMLDLVRHSPLLRRLVEEVQAALGTGCAVLLVLDDQMANLPLHAVPLGDGYWSDVASIGRIPAIGALRFTPKNRSWSGRSLVAGDSDGHLPGAAMECREVGRMLVADPLIGNSCTLAAVTGALTDTDFDIVHLAVHGRADVRHGARGSLLFAGPPGARPEWASFDVLAAASWRADLIVFSGCSTAVGGPRDGVGLYGVAQAAAQAGATTVVASLWPVNDQSAARFMTTFYRELTRQRQQQDVVDLRSVMDVARKELRTALRPAAGRDEGIVPSLPAAASPARDGRQLLFDAAELTELSAEEAPSDEDAAFLHWAPFVLIGDPALVVGEAPHG